MKKTAAATGMKRHPPKDADDYIAGFPPDVQSALEKVRGTIKTFLPDAMEVISYQIPTFKYKGKFLVAYAAFKDHCSVYTMSKAILQDLSDDLKAYDTSGVTIHFQPDKVLPATLLKKIIKARIKELGL